MLILENICENSSTLRAIYFINNIIEILFIAVPAALVLVLSIDIAKNVISNDENEIKETLSKGIKRIIYASLLFFVPLLVKVSFNFLGNMGVKYLDCFSMATKENIEKYEEKEETAKERAEAERKQKLEKEREEKEAAIAKKKEESAKQRAENKSSAVTNGAAAINKKAIELAWPVGTSSKKWKYPNGSATSAFSAAYSKYPYRTKKCLSSYGCGPMKGASCDRYVGAVVWASGYDTEFPANVGFSKKTHQGYHMAHSSKWKKVNYSFKTSELKAGDIIIYGKKSGGGHILIVVDINGKMATAEAGLNSSYGHIVTDLGKLTKSSRYNRFEVYRAVS